MRNQDRKILLVLDNAACHAHVTQLTAIKLLYLLPNTTSKLQPLDHVLYNASRWSIDSAICDMSLHVWMDVKVSVNFQRRLLSEMLLTGLKPPGHKL